MTDVYHQVTVSDPYRWLENAADPKVHEWSAAQDARTRKYLDELPQRAPIFKQLMSQISATSSSYHELRAVGPAVFAYYTQPPKQQPMIAVLTNAANPSLARIIVDPNTINPKGTTAIDWFVPSPDGKLLAVSMSENGSEDGTLHLFDVASAKEVGPQIPRVQFPTRRRQPGVEPRRQGILVYALSGTRQARLRAAFLPAGLLSQDGR